MLLRELPKGVVYRELQEYSREPWAPGTRGLAAYASSVSFGHAEHCFLTVWTVNWTPKSLCQNLLKMTFLRR